MYGWRNRNRLTSPFSFISRSYWKSDFKLTMNDTEEAVGICGFANKATGFEGILKQRYSDFVVREIEPKGEIAILKCIDGDDVENQAFPKQLKHGIDSKDIFATFMEKMNMINGTQEIHNKDELEDFINGCIEHNPESPTDFMLCAATLKEKRTQIHQLIKALLSEFIDSDTIQVNSIQHIRLVAIHKRAKGQVVYRSSWPPNVGNYLRFVLMKENIDTMSAVNLLCKVMRLKDNNSIYFAGTKDKRGITSQWCTMYRRKPSVICRINKYQLPPTIRVGNFEFVNESQQLGNLCGNRFEIVLREIDASAELVHDACRAVQESGFINYFGLQRFGVKNGSGTHLIGKAIFLNDWFKAIDLIFDFTGDNSEDYAISQMKAHYANREYKKALSHTPNHFYVEKIILEQLSEHEMRSDLSLNSDRMQEIFLTIPKNNRMLYAHAFQSYIWNLVATKRLTDEYGGCNVVVGDLVLIADDANSTLLLDTDAILASGSDVPLLPNEFPEVKIAVDDEVVMNDSIHDDTTTTTTPAGIHVVTEDDVIHHRFQMKHVVLPLPGYDAIFPKNAIKEVFVSLLEENGISLQYLKSNKTIKRFGLNGGYRKVLNYPENFEWSLVKYNDPNETLNHTELEQFRSKIEMESKDNVSSELPDTAVVTSSENDVVVKKRRIEELTALILKFNLPSSTYATMMLRELTKRSTDVEHHARLTSIAAGK